ncbi:MAG: molybdopterin molybdotransferase MoeA [Planctomycetes bacterium]|nr:molybdopterin molybdotransferase MoeA [Planctomycetota bacterium]
MLSVAAALAIVLEQARPRSPVVMPLSPDMLGLVLAEDVVSDLDMPPFDKAMMDGFALRSSDLRDGRAELTIVEEIPAGKTPTVEVKSGQASRIMTGAPIPQGVDAVVMIERCEIAGQNVRVNEPRAKPRMNILERAKEMRVGEVVLRSGARLGPAEFGLLAAVGHTRVHVQPAPRVAVLSTGDEIVDPEQKPGPGQIRNSNGAMLLAQVARAGGVPRFCGIARDEPTHLRDMIAAGLQADVLILSGGVSAGKLDLVPGVLAELGVEALFHKVAMKPGKPILFGVKGREPEAQARESVAALAGASGSERSTPCLVFGLPGNPVSSMVGFELFVRPALRALIKLDPNACWVKARLTKDFPYRTDRPTYHPARLQMADAGWTVEPTPWFGSPDLRGVQPANAFALLPEGDHPHPAGETLMVLRVDND